MSRYRPTIKGAYILSHIKALVAERGESAFYELRGRYQKPLDFKKDDQVPVAEEVAILEHITDMFSPKVLSVDERALSAGHLHFTNFTSTPLWNMLQPLVRANTHSVLMQSHRIGNWVFQNVNFTAENVSATTVRIKLENNDYPLGHFQGFFEEWLRWSDKIGAVEAEADAHGAYIYTITWR